MQAKATLAEELYYLKSGEYFSWNYYHIYRKHAFPLGITPASEILDSPDTLPIKAYLHLYLVYVRYMTLNKECG